MYKVSKEAKTKYLERINEYKQIIEAIREKRNKLEAEVRQIEEGQAATVEREGANYKRLELARENLNLVSYHILMNSLSLSLLGIKNEGYLNEARKCCYKSIICLEEIVTPYLDVPFSDYQDGLLSIEEIKDREKYELARKLGFAIDSIEEGFGKNSKWKWSFVELEGRYAAVTKNLLNLKTFVAGLDPRVEGYIERLALMSLAKRLLQQASDRYREKYELSTLRLDDIKMGISFLAALKRLHTLLGESDEADIIKRKIDIWKTKMESDQKKQEQAQRMERLKKKY